MHDEKLTPFEHYCLLIRNILVAVAATLFLISVLPIEALEARHHDITGIAYLVGACAYVAEFVEMSDEQKRKSPHHKRRIFMPNVFGLLYMILSVCHFLE